VVFKGAVVSAKALYQVAQASDQLERSTGFSPAAKRVTVGGDDRQVTVPHPMTGKPLTLDLPSAELFAFAIKGLDPKTASAVLADVATVRSDPTGKQSVMREPAMTSPLDPKQFAREMVASGTMVGSDVTGKPLPKREEIQRGYGVYLQAFNTKTEVLVFGRTPEVNHSNASFFGYTSERMNGSVLMPEKWNLFLNNCWLMGGIKGDVSFAPITVFNTGGGGQSDFRSLESLPGKDGLPNEFIITVSVAEIEGLKTCGYTAVEHPTFGTILQPGTDKASVARREGVTMKQLDQVMQLMALTQAADNVTGDNRVAPSQQAFLGQDKASATATLGGTVATLKSGGLVDTDPGNKFIRKGEAKAAIAYDRIEKMGVRFEGTTFIEKTWHEVRQAVLIVADDAIADAVKTRGISAAEAAAIRTEVVRHVERQRDAGELGFGTDQREVRAFVAGRVGATDGRREFTTGLHKNVAAMETEFRKTLGERGFPPDEHDALWDGFQQHTSRIGDLRDSRLDKEKAHFIGAHSTGFQSFLGVSLYREPPPVVVRAPIIDSGQKQSKL
jgi:hypothetical protein